MKLSLIICTFNNSLQLEQLLDDLVYQFANLSENEASQIEILLIDNNSNDNTKEIAYKFSESTAMTLRYYQEARQGRAAARNFAIKQSKGDLLCFLDDDLSLDEEWLTEVYKIADECKAKEIGVYGGRIIPLWQERTPNWLGTEAPYGVYQEAFSGHSHGDEADLYPLVEAKQKTHYPNGTFFMFRREIFENCGDFRTDLGPDAGGGLGLHDDREFLDYLKAVNIPMLYVPKCTTFHPVDPERMSKKAIRRWYYKSGKSSYWMWHTDRMRRDPHPLICIRDQLRPWLPSFSHSIKISGVPIYLFFKVAFLFLAGLVSNLSFNAKRTFWMGLMFSKAMGEIAGAQMVDEHFKNRKFSFKDKLQSKGFESFAKENVNQA